MAEKKHQHTVPACYLANWGINGNQGRHSKIYFFNIYTHQADISSLEKFPTVNCFYDIPEFGESEKILENFFMGIEGDYSLLLQKVLQCIESDGETHCTKEPVLSSEDKSELTAQFAMQIVRTLAFRNYYKHTYKSLKTGLPFAKNPVFSNEVFQRMHTNELISFSLANFYANLLNDRNWIFLINYSDVPFFTSDNPGIFIDRRINPIEPISPASKEVTFYMSLSPTVAVELYDKSILKAPETHVPIELPGIVQEYNRRLFSKCTRLMFSNKNDFSCLIGGEK